MERCLWWLVARRILKPEVPRRASASFRALNGVVREPVTEQLQAAKLLRTIKLGEKKYSETWPPSVRVEMGERPLFPTAWGLLDGLVKLKWSVGRCVYKARWKIPVEVYICVFVYVCGWGCRGGGLKRAVGVIR